MDVYGECKMRDDKLQYGTGLHLQTVKEEIRDAPGDKILKKRHE